VSESVRRSLRNLGCGRSLVQPRNPPAPGQRERRQTGSPLSRPRPEEEATAPRVGTRARPGKAGPVAAAMAASPAEAEAEAEAGAEAVATAP
jgi:hypothetical protein